MKYTTTVLACLSACSATVVGGKLKERETTMVYVRPASRDLSTYTPRRPTVTVETVTVTPSVAESLISSSQITTNFIPTTVSPVPMSGPGGSSNGATTFTTVDVAGNTFVEVKLCSLVTVTASVQTTTGDTLSSVAAAAKISGISSPSANAVPSATQSSAAVRRELSQAAGTALGVILPILGFALFIGAVFGVM